MPLLVGLASVRNSTTYATTNPRGPGIWIASLSQHAGGVVTAPTNSAVRSRLGGGKEHRVL